MPPCPLKGKLKTFRNPIFKNENGGFEFLFQNRRLAFVRYSVNYSTAETTVFGFQEANQRKYNPNNLKIRFNKPELLMLIDGAK